MSSTRVEELLTSAQAGVADPGKSLETLFTYKLVGGSWTRKGKDIWGNQQAGAVGPSFGYSLSLSSPPQNPWELRLAVGMRGAARNSSTRVEVQVLISAQANREKF